MPVSRVLKVSLTVAIAALALSGCMQRRGPVAYAPAMHRNMRRLRSSRSRLARSDPTRYDGLWQGAGLSRRHRSRCRRAPAAALSSRPAAGLASPPCCRRRSGRYLEARPVERSVPQEAGRRCRRRCAGCDRGPRDPARSGLSPRCRRPPAHRRVRPGRPDQLLFGGCGRRRHLAADRLGAGARRTPAELAAAITARLQGGFIREPYVRSRSRPTGRSSSSARSRLPASIPTCPT